MNCKIFVLELVGSLFLEIKKMLVYRQIDIFCS